jgi:hypothetical protein
LSVGGYGGAVLPTSATRRSAARVVALVLLVACSAGGCSLIGSDEIPGDGAAAEATPSAPPVSSPAPMPTFDTTSVVGDYAADFPVELLAAPDDATVLASSAVPRDDGLVEVSLNLATGLPVKQIVKSYADRLDQAGFSPSDAAEGAADLDTYTAYTRTKGKKNPRLESVHLGVLDDGELRLVTLSGIVESPQKD